MIVRAIRCAQNRNPVFGPKTIEEPAIIERLAVHGTSGRLQAYKLLNRNIRNREKRMKRGRCWIVVAAAWLAGSTALFGSTRGDITEQTRVFLDAYARGDRATVISMIDPERITVFGSDLEEVFRGKAAVEKMLGDDLRLWKGSARIFDMQHVSVFQEGSFASIFFDAWFQVAGAKPVPVRFSMVWRRARKDWKLVQSSNVVPTQGQSAEKLLGSSSQ